MAKDGTSKGTPASAKLAAAVSTGLFAALMAAVILYALLAG